MSYLSHPLMFKVVIFGFEVARFNELVIVSSKLFSMICDSDGNVLQKSLLPYVECSISLNLFLFSAYFYKGNDCFILCYFRLRLRLSQSKWSILFSCALQHLFMVYFIRLVHGVFITPHSLCRMTWCMYLVLVCISALLNA